MAMGKVGIDIALAVLLLLLMKHPVIVQAVIPAILEAPVNRTVGLGQPPLNLTCRVRGENLFIEVDGMHFDHNTVTAFVNRGIIVNNGRRDGEIITQQVTIELTTRNNNTEIICSGISEEGPTAYSDPGFIFIAGHPLSPSLQYSVIDENTLQVYWEEPYTSEDFPITGYYLRVVDTYQSSETEMNETDTYNSKPNETYSYQAVLTDTALGPDSRSFNVTQVAPTSCTNLTLQIWAENSVGNSSAGTAYGAFPFRPTSPPRETTGMGVTSSSTSNTLHPITGVTTHTVSTAISTTTTIIVIPVVVIVVLLLLLVMGGVLSAVYVLRTKASRRKGRGGRGDIQESVPEVVYEQVKS